MTLEIENSNDFERLVTALEKISRDIKSYLNFGATPQEAPQICGNTTLIKLSFQQRTQEIQRNK